MVILKCRMKYILISSLLVWFSLDNYAQSPGLVIQAGITAAYSKDKNVTKAKEGHYGWMFGADARILEGDLYFILGGQYHQTSVKSSASADFFKNNDWKILMGRFGFGFNVIKFTDNLAIRSKILGSLNYVMDAPAGGLNVDGYKEINDSYLGVVSGLGVTIGSLDIDLDFQYGAINAYKFKPETTFNSWTLMTGFHF
jgi:hypothetical protein